MRALLIIGLAIAVTGCNTVASLGYTPPPSISQTGPQAIVSVTAIDQRSEPPNRLATIMGGFGNPLKTLDTAKPVKDEVADAFTAGLRARGMLQQPGPTAVTILLTIANSTPT